MEYNVWIQDHEEIFPRLPSASALFMGLTVHLAGRMHGGDHVLVSFTYLGIFNVLSRFIWPNIPAWITLVCPAVCIAAIVAAAFFGKKIT